MDRDSRDVTTEGSMLFPALLISAGTIICTVVLMESYFQLGLKDFSFIKLAHENEMFLDYGESQQPNRGIWHLMGWIGSACFILMMFYSLRKRLFFMQEAGALSYWLNAHMFLGVVGTVLVTTHTTYKLGGLVSISYYSMMLVAVSGLLGRYLYLQIPRNISGNELRMGEIETLLADINEMIEKFAGDNREILTYFRRISGPPMTGRLGMIGSILAMIKNDIMNFVNVSKIRIELGRIPGLPDSVKKILLKLIKKKGKLVRSTNFLETSQRLLHYWHVFHKPFAVIMFLIMFLHILVFYMFRVGG